MRVCLGCLRAIERFDYCDDCGAKRRKSGRERKRHSTVSRGGAPRSLQPDARRREDHRGYIRVYMPTPSGWEYEHRLVMEATIGRRLRSDESVHHKNEVRSDNRPENLELMNRGEHIAHHNRIAPKRKKVA